MTKPIRVLHIISSLSKGSGVMNMLMNIYRYIDHTAVQFDFLYYFNKENSYIEEIYRYGGQVYRVNLSETKMISSYFKNLNSFFEEHSSLYNIIHVHTPSLSWYAMYLAKKYKISKRILHSHGTMYGETKLKSIRNYMFTTISKKYSNEFFACSNAAGEFMFGQAVANENKIKIINNSIESGNYSYNTKSREKIRKQLNLNKKTVVGHVGSFIPVKNHDYIISIFQNLLNIKEDCILLLIGEGPLEESIKARVNELGLSKHVKFLGSRSDVGELMQAMDVFLLPSLKEGFPVVSIEAQTSGLPCIVSDTITQEIKLTNLVQFMDIKTDSLFWARKIIDVLQTHTRKSMQNEIEDKGFSIEETSKDIAHYYEKICNYPNGKNLKQ